MFHRHELTLAMAQIETDYHLLLTDNYLLEMGNCFLQKYTLETHIYDVGSNTTLDVSTSNSS